MVIHANIDTYVGASCKRAKGTPKNHFLRRSSTCRVTTTATTTAISLLLALQLIGTVSFLYRIRPSGSFSVPQQLQRYNIGHSLCEIIAPNNIIEVFAHDHKFHLQTTRTVQLHSFSCKPNNPHYPCRSSEIRNHVQLNAIQESTASKMSSASDGNVENVLKSSTDSNQIENTAIQPLYITIGPPCSGKTTWIKKYNVSSNTTIYDICIDDQPGVYYSVSTNLYIPNYFTNATIADTIEPQTRIILPSEVLFGRTVQERVNEQRELRAVLHRLGDVMTKEDFREAIKSPLLFHIVEDIIDEFKIENKRLELPRTIDLFVLEAIFRRQPTSNDNTLDEPSCSAIERSQKLLHCVADSVPIAYGNTNTRPSDYTSALQMALQRKRPVHFVVYNDNETEHQELFDLSLKNGLHGLVRRNIYRLLHTGRYIPVQVISDMRDRTNEMIRDILLLQPTDDKQPPNRHRKISKLQLHQELSRIAGFEMDNNRLISSAIVAHHVNISSSISNRSNIHGPSNDSKQVRRRPWDRPSSAVRGYNGKMQRNSDE